MDIMLIVFYTFVFLLFPASEKFRYLLDIIYHYEYKVNVETYFAGSSNNRSTLDVKAVVSNFLCILF